MKCSNCPIKDYDCDGETGVRPRFCDWAASGDATKLRMIQNVSLHKYNRPGGYRRRDPSKSVRIYHYCIPWSGLGQIGYWLGRCLHDAGMDVAYDCHATDHTYAAQFPFVADRLDLDPAPNERAVQVLNPDYVRPYNNRTIAFTMWETNRVSEYALTKLNQCAAVAVPCAWNAESFREQGVTVPVKVVPLGIAASDGFRARPWHHGRPFTFGMAAKMAHGGVRKGINEGIAAFTKAFPNKNTPVRMLVKVFPDCLPQIRPFDDDRIIIITDPFSIADMADWYENIDCLFVPSKGEGWGMHTLQAMASGRPVAAANYGGTAEFFTPECGWELPYEIHTAGADFYDNTGEWCVPTEDGMIDILRQIYNSPKSTLISRGFAAAQRAAGFTWQRTAAGVMDLLASIAGPAHNTQGGGGPPAETPVLPSVLRMAADLAKTTARQAAKGRTLTDAEANARLAICSTCPNLIIESGDDWRCGSTAKQQGCGCHLKRAATWSEKLCPANKWPQLDSTQ